MPSYETNPSSRNYGWCLGGRAWKGSLDVATCVANSKPNKANLQKCPNRFNRVLDVVFSFSFFFFI